MNLEALFGGQASPMPPELMRDEFATDWDESKHPRDKEGQFAPSEGAAESDPDTAIVAYVGGGMLDAKDMRTAYEGAREELRRSLRDFPERAAAIKEEARNRLDELFPGQDYVVAYHVSAEKWRDHSQRGGLGEFRSMTLSKEAAERMISEDMRGKGWLYTIRVPKESVGVVVDYSDPNISDYSWQQEILNDRPIPIQSYAEAKQYRGRKTRLSSVVVFAADWDEKKHPQDEKEKWTDKGEYVGDTPIGGKYAVTVPSMSDEDWFNQQEQHPQKGPPGISYVRNYIGKGKSKPVDTLLYRNDSGNLLLGILYHYPKDLPPYEKAGNINVMVDPLNRGQGIGSQLIREAGRRWNIDLWKQNYTPEGAALARAVTHPDLKKKPKYDENGWLIPARVGDGKKPNKRKHSSHIEPLVMAAAAWDESKHPRDNEGQFAPSEGGEASGERIAATSISETHADERWRKVQIDAAQRDYDPTYGWGRTPGDVTAEVDASQFPLTELAKLPGLNDEHLRTDLLGDTKAKELRDTLTESIPIKVPIRVEVNHLGKAYIAEGNHRVARAVQVGHKFAPVHITYKASGERIPGPFNLKRFELRESFAVDWDPSKHPRDEKGRWVDSSGATVSMYHGTLDSYLSSIRESGLLVSSKAGKKNYSDPVLYEGERGESVYMTQSEDQAHDWSEQALTNLERDGDDSGVIPVILQLQIPLDEFTNRAKRDEYGMPYDARFVGNIKPEWIKAYRKVGHDKYELFASSEAHTGFVTLYVVVLIKDDGAQKFAVDWDESEHPRDKDGKFAPAGSQGQGADDAVSAEDRAAIAKDMERLDAEEAARHKEWLDKEVQVRLSEVNPELRAAYETNPHLNELLRSAIEDGQPFARRTFSERDIERNWDGNEAGPLWVEQYEQFKDVVGRAQATYAESPELVGGNEAIVSSYGDTIKAYAGSVPDERFDPRELMGGVSPDALHTDEPGYEVADMVDSWAHYTAENYRAINTYLRSGEDLLEGTAAPAMDAMIADLDKLAEHELSPDIFSMQDSTKVFRGVYIDKDSAAGFLELATKGARWSDPAFLSTSTDAAEAYNQARDRGKDRVAYRDPANSRGAVAILEIEIPLGQTGFVGNSGEGEIVLPRNQELEVVGHGWNRMVGSVVVKMRAVQPGG